MTAVADVLDEHRPDNLLGDYLSFVERLDVDKGVKSSRRVAAHRFLERHRSLEAWMSRPTPARLADLHRHKAWPLLTWAAIDQRIHVDLELLLAKPGGVDVGVWWLLAHPDDESTARRAASELGWSANWTRQVIRHTMPVLCLSLDKTLTEVTVDDFVAAAAEAEQACVRTSTRDRFTGRCLALWQLCFQAGIVDEPPPDAKPPSRSPVEHASSVLRLT